MISPEAQNVVGGIQYLKWQPLYDRERPFNLFLDPPKDAKDQRRTNLVYENHRTNFTDVRGQVETFTLDKNGFSFHQYHLPFDAFEDEEAVESEFLPEVERIIKTEVEGADRIFIFDWKLRNSSPINVGHTVDLNRPTSWLSPSIHCHIGMQACHYRQPNLIKILDTDQAPSAVLQRTLTHLPDEADYLLKGRVRIVNFWKPLKNVVEDWPLALCDGSNILPEDVVETDHIRRGYLGATYNVLYREKYKWYYMSTQSKDDVCLLKIFDSSRSAKAKCCPHASFQNPQAKAGAPIRESIEVRALVYTFV